MMHVKSVFTRPRGGQPVRIQRSALVLGVMLTLIVLLSSTTQGAFSQDGSDPSNPQSPQVSWTIEPVDAPPYFYNMTQRSLAFKPDGTPCVAYGGDSLYYSCYNFSVGAWGTTLVDNSPRVGEYAALAINSSYRPFITYYDAANGRLKLAYYIGLGGNCGPSLDWQCDVVSNPVILAPEVTAPEEASAAVPETPIDGDTPAPTPETPIDGDAPVPAPETPIDGNQPTPTPEAPADGEDIQFEDQAETFQRPWLGSMDPNISLDVGGYGKYSSIFIDHLNRIHITYYDQVEGSLRYAFTEDLINWAYNKPYDYRTDGSAGQWTSIAVDSNSWVHISFMSEKYDDLMYVRRRANGSWDACRVDTSEHVGSFSSIAVEGDGRPHISYLDFSTHDLKYARLADPRGCNEANDVSDWRTQRIDSDGMAGWYSSITIDPINQIHISYYEASNGNLRHVYRDGDGIWRINRNMLTEGNVGLFTSIAHSPQGALAISYFNASAGAFEVIYKSGTSWIALPDVATNSRDVGLSTSLAVNSEGVPFISYLDTSGGYLKFARRYGAYWSKGLIELYGGLFSSIDLSTPYQPRIAYYSTYNNDPKYARWTASGWVLSHIASTYNVGKYTSLAIGPFDISHVSYYDETNSNLVYAKSNVGATSWITRTIDHVNNVGMYTSIALDGTGRPHISYYDDTNDALKHAYVAVLTDAWVVEFVDNPVVDNVGGYSSIGIDRFNNPHISYYDFTNHVLKYAYKSGGIWNISLVDAAGDVGKFSSLALYNQAADPNNDTRNVAYYDATNGRLKFASRTAAAGAWTVEVVDDNGDVGYYCSLALNGSGLPAISYYDNTNGDLKFAYSFAIPNARYYAPLIFKP